MCLTSDRYSSTVVALVSAVCAGCVALVFALVFNPEPLDHQPDLVAGVPFHPYLPIPHPGLKRGIWEAIVSGGHHSHLPPLSVVSVQEPLKVLRTRAIEGGHSAGQ